MRSRPVSATTSRLLARSYCSPEGYIAPRDGPARVPRNAGGTAAAGDAVASGTSREPSTAVASAATRARPAHPLVRERTAVWLLRNIGRDLRVDESVESRPGGDRPPRPGGNSPKTGHPLTRSGGRGSAELSTPRTTHT